jgi:hypothetical protein
MDFLTAVSRLWSFDHHTCDAALVRAHVDVWGVKLANGTAADASVYGGSAFIVLWTLAVLWGSVDVWTGRKTLSGQRRVGAVPFRVKLFVIAGPALGVLFLCLQARSITNYVEACSAFLQLR